MLARDLMNRDVPFVSVDADLGYVAKLLSECRLGAIPVVDSGGSPIGIITRSNIERARAPKVSSGAIELGEIPPFLLKSRKPPVFHANGRALRDIMTAPVVSAPSGAPLKDIAALMEQRRLKRIPVVDGGHKLIGVVLRKAVMEAVNGNGAETHERPVLTITPPERDRCAVATVEEFRELVAAHEREAEAQRAAQKRAAEAVREERIRELAQRRLTDSQWREMLSLARRSAAAGLTEHMLIRFPAQLCADGGRAINAPDPHWPETLRGEPADVFHRWRNELQPHGFRIAAQIVSFPDGIPGDAALFLQWGGGES